MHGRRVASDRQEEEEAGSSSVDVSKRTHFGYVPSRGRLSRQRADAAKAGTLDAIWAADPRKRPSTAPIESTLNPGRDPKRTFFYGYGSAEKGAEEGSRPSTAAEPRHDAFSEAGRRSTIRSIIEGSEPSGTADRLCDQSLGYHGVPSSTGNSAESFFGNAGAKLAWGEYPHSRFVEERGKKIVGSRGSEVDALIYARPEDREALTRHYTQITDYRGAIGIRGDRVDELGRTEQLIDQVKHRRSGNSTIDTLLGGIGVDLDGSAADQERLTRLYHGSAGARFRDKEDGPPRGRVHAGHGDSTVDAIVFGRDRDDSTATAHAAHMQQTYQGAGSRSGRQAKPRQKTLGTPSEAENVIYGHDFFDKSTSGLAYLDDRLFEGMQGMRSRDVARAMDPDMRAKMFYEQKVNGGHRRDQLAEADEIILGRDIDRSSTNHPLNSDAVASILTGAKMANDDKMHANAMGIERPLVQSLSEPKAFNFRDGAFTSSTHITDLVKNNEHLFGGSAGLTTQEMIDLQVLRRRYVTYDLVPDLARRKPAKERSPYTKLGHLKTFAGHFDGAVHERGGATAGSETAAQLYSRAYAGTAGISADDVNRHRGERDPGAHVFATPESELEGAAGVRDTRTAKYLGSQRRHVPPPPSAGKLLSDEIEGGSAAAPAQRKAVEQFIGVTTAGAQSKATSKNKQLSSMLGEEESKPQRGSGVFSSAHGAHNVLDLGQQTSYATHLPGLEKGKAKMGAAKAAGTADAILYGHDISYTQADREADHRRFDGLAGASTESIAKSTLLDQAGARMHMDRGKNHETVLRRQEVREADAIDRHGATTAQVSEKRTREVREKPRVAYEQLSREFVEGTLMGRLESAEDQAIALGEAEALVGGRAGISTLHRYSTLELRPRRKKMAPHTQEQIAHALYPQSQALGKEFYRREEELHRQSLERDGAFGSTQKHILERRFRSTVFLEEGRQEVDLRQEAAKKVLEQAAHDAAGLRSNHPVAGGGLDSGPRKGRSGSSDSVANAERAGRVYPPRETRVLQLSDGQFVMVEKRPFDEGIADSTPDFLRKGRSHTDMLGETDRAGSRSVDSRRAPRGKPRYMAPPRQRPPHASTVSFKQPGSETHAQHFGVQRNTYVPFGVDAPSRQAAIERFTTSAASIDGVSRARQLVLDQMASQGLSQALVVERRKLSSALAAASRSGSDLGLRPASASLPARPEWRS